MTESRVSRRRMITGTGRLVAGAGAVWMLSGSGLGAQSAGEARPLKIGILVDRSGENALPGVAEERGIRLAIDAVNAAGGLLGRPVEGVAFDTQTRPGYVARTLAGFVERNDLSFLIGGTSGGVAGAVAAVAQSSGVVYMDSNSRVSPAAAACHRTRFSWNAGGEQLARATVLNVHRVFGRRWLLIVADELWGRYRAEVQRGLIGTAGGTVVGEIPVSAGETNAVSILDAVAGAAPDAVFPVVDQPTLDLLARGARARGLAESSAWVVPAPEWPMVAGRKPQDVFGVFPVTWYWRLERYGVPDFVKAYWRAFPDASPRMPGSFVYNGYMAARALFDAISRAGATSSHAVIRVLERARFSAGQRLQHGEAWVDPESHTLQQPVYLATANPNPRHPEDLFHLLAWAGAGEIADPTAAECRLEPLAVTPADGG